MSIYSSIPYLFLFTYHSSLKHPYYSVDVHITTFANITKTKIRIRMTMILHIVLLFATITNLLSAHPTIYPHISLKRNQINREHSLPYPPPVIISYHIHVTYTLFNPLVRKKVWYIIKQSVAIFKVVKEAMDLRKLTRDEFQDYLGPDCPGRYDYGYLCMINDHNIGIQ